jgi:hypothetical protein
MFNYFYKIENLLNGNFYYGVHKTKNINDGYMGSGRRIKNAVKKYKVENFKKEFLLFFETYEEALEYEIEFVNEELIKDSSCYNIACGGGSWNDFNKTGNNIKTLRCGPSLRHKITGEIINPISILEFNELFNSNMYDGIAKNKVIVKDKNGKKFAVDKDDPRYINGELIFIHKNKFIAKDKNGNMFLAYKDDPRYLSGEITGSTKNNKLCDLHKKKIGKANEISQAKERNSQYGTMWIHNEYEIKKIKKEVFYEFEKTGWMKGRKLERG